QALQEEVKSLSHEITRIAQKTTFAGATVLDGGKAPNNLMRPVAGQQGNPPTKFEYFFQVGANAKDEISLQCGAFTMEGIMSMANEGVAQAQQIKFANNVADAGKDDHFGLVIEGNNKTSAYWVVATASAAQRTLATIDKFIETVDSKRAALGAIQNRMESTIRNQSSISENESDARSRIRDTDFALETAALTQNQIIQQASQTILSQANQRPTVALNLLGGGR
ncbi:flagellin, partial [Anaerobiospirillum succiniciproducens]|uniref:flagellin n=1 Tax=Anaerobiospirillum succiniciproducens TaxID=13335 RepID=UPI002941EF26